MTTPHQKFLFEIDFDAPAAEESPHEDVMEIEEEPEIPPEPTFSEAEIRAAREESFLAGKEDGLAQARGERDAEISGQLQSLCAQLAALQDIQSGHADDAREAALSVALATVRKLFPALEQRHGMAEIENLVTDCMHRLRDEPRLVIRAADAQLDILKERIESWVAKNAIEAKLVFLSEDHLGSGDVRIEWADGGAERDSSRMWQEIDDVVARVMPTVSGKPKSVPQPTEKAAPQPDNAIASVIDHVPHEPILAAGIANVS